MIDAGTITFQEFVHYVGIGADVCFDIVPEHQDMFEKFLALDTSLNDAVTDCNEAIKEWP